MQIASFEHDAGNPGSVVNWPSNIRQRVFVCMGVLILHYVKSSGNKKIGNIFELMKELEGQRTIQNKEGLRLWKPFLTHHENLSGCFIPGGNKG